MADWMAGQLAGDHPWMRGRTGSGRTLAAELVVGRRLLPVLDGLDEIPGPARGAAVKAINAQFPEYEPFVLTSRREEYTDAVAEVGVLAAEAVIDLQPLRLADLAAYLPRSTSRPEQASKWQPVLDHLRTHRHDPAAAARLAVLATPLMTFLVRTAYSDTDADPTDLLVHELADSARLEDHLLAAFIPVVYRPEIHPRATAAPAGHALTFLAESTPGTGDVAWWRLYAALPRRARAVTGLVIGPAAGLVAGLTAQAAVDSPAGLAAGLVVGLMVGVASFAPRLTRLPAGRRLVAGLGTGLTYGALSALIAGPPAGPSAGLAAGLTVGLMTSEPQRTRLSNRARMVIGIGVGLALGVPTTAAVGLPVGLASGLVIGLAVGSTGEADPGKIASPGDILRVDARTWAAFVLTAGCAVGLTYATTAGPAVGLRVGFGTALASVLVGGTLLFAAGRLAIACCWLTLARQLPLRLMAFPADAHQRGILRQAGAVYQFRHNRLQEHLADSGRNAPPTKVPSQGPTPNIVAGP